MAAFSKKSVITAVPQDAAAPPFEITITSSAPFARGATADLYLGEVSRAVSPGMLVALKVYTRTLIPDKAREQLCRRELQVGRYARHQHILPFLGVAITEQFTALVTPFVRNGNMLEYIRDNPTADRNVLILQLADAVDHLHNALYIAHGDLKCENILISDDGNVLLMDLGLCSSTADLRRLGQNGDVASGSITFSDSISENRNRYTPLFAAPELILSSESEELPSKTTKSDVYAFGILILQAFTAPAPLSMATYNDALRHALLPLGGRRRRPESAIRQGLIDPWWNMLLKCTTRPPAERPDMRDVLLRLKASYTSFKDVQDLRSSIVRRATGAEARVSILEIVMSLERSRDGLQLMRDSKDDLSQAALQLWQHYVSKDDILDRERMSLELRALAAVVGNVSSSAAMAMRPIREVLQTGEHDTYETCPFPLRGHEKRVTSVAFLSHELLLVNLSPKGGNTMLHIWDLRAGTSHAFPTDEKWVCPSPGSNLVASFGQGPAGTWTRTGHDMVEKRRIVHHDAKGVLAAALSPDGAHLVAAGASGGLSVWNTATGALVDARSDGHHRVRAVSFSPNGTRVAVAGGHTALPVYSWSAEEERLSPIGEALIGLMDDVCAFAFSPDGGALVSGSVDCTVGIWDLDARAMRLTLLGHRRAVRAVAFAPGGAHVASAGDDRTVRLWDAATGAAVAVLKGHTDAVSCVVFSPDGTRVVSGSYDKTVRVWDRVHVKSMSEEGAEAPSSTVTERQELTSTTWDS